MNYTPSGKIPFTEQQWENYKKNLNQILGDSALDCETIAGNAEYSSYVANYVEEEVIGNETKNKLQGFTYRLANMEVNGKDGTKVFPVINKYLWHHIKAILYFKLNDEKKIEVATVEVSESLLMT